MSDLLDTSVSDMTVRDQIKVGLLLAAGSAVVIGVIGITLEGVKYSAARLAERQSKHKDDEEK